MESGSIVMGSRSGKKKHSKRKKANKDECIINNLPESIIGSILSLLPIKDAVRTSVLSKQWICRWTSMAKLDLNDRMFYSPVTETIEKRNFENFVNKALLDTGSSDISLVFYHKYNASCVNTWISSILMNCNIKYLSVYLHFELCFSALSSHFLFNKSSLEELDMKVCRCAIRVPKSYVCFVHLKILKLSGIIFTLDSPSNSEDLKLSLPVLKIFETKNCTFSKGVTLDVPLLEHVFIKQYPESLSYEPLNCAIKFSASPLTEFTYCGYGYISQCIILLDPSSAHNASANIVLRHYQEDSVPEAGSRASMLLHQFRDVKDLKFQGRRKVLAQTKLDILPVFGMLSYLEFGFVTIEILLSFLFKSSVLKTLVFKEIYKFNKEILNSAAVPECLTSTLHAVKIAKVYGKEHELCLATFLKKNGLVPKRMSFTIYYWRRESKAIEKFIEKLPLNRGMYVNIIHSPYD